MKPIVFIAGPYIADGSYAAIDANIHEARSAAIQLAAHGIPFFCPHTHTAHFETVVPHIPEAFFKELDLLILRFCSAIYLVGDWANSKGAVAEYSEASRLGLRSFMSFPQLLKWYKGTNR